MHYGRTEFLQESRPRVSGFFSPRRKVCPAIPGGSWTPNFLLLCSYNREKRVVPWQWHITCNMTWHITWCRVEMKFGNENEENLCEGRAILTDGFCLTEAYYGIAQDSQACYNVAQAPVLIKQPVPCLLMLFQNDDVALYWLQSLSPFISLRTVKNDYHNQRQLY